MNNNANVSDATRKKVTLAMEELGYRPNSIAQSLASNCSNSAGLLVSELKGPFYGPMMSGIENTLRNQGKHVIITAGHSDAEREQQGIEFLISRNCDALILHVEAISDEYLIKLSKGKTPFVLLNRYIANVSFTLSELYTFAIIILSYYAGRSRLPVIETRWIASLR